MLRATGISGPWLKMGSAPSEQHRCLMTHVILPGCSCSRLGSIQCCSWNKICLTTATVVELPAVSAWDRKVQGFWLLFWGEWKASSGVPHILWTLTYIFSTHSHSSLVFRMVLSMIFFRPYTPLQRQPTRTNLIASIPNRSLFFQLPLSSVSYLTTHPVLSQKTHEDLESTKAQLF